MARRGSNDSNPSTGFPIPIAMEDVYLQILSGFLLHFLKAFRILGLEIVLKISCAGVLQKKT